ncbi:MAG: RNA-binding domain-containing protein [Patescibacteria group bacterium]
MSLPVNIDNLVNSRTVESERVEFKKGWNPEDIMHSICAFANDINNWGGGYIIVGIKEVSGVPVLPPIGIEKNQIDVIQKKIIEIYYKINPNYTPVVSPETYEEKHILVIWVPGGDNRPYSSPISLSKINKTRIEWVRKGPNTVRANNEDKRRLMELASKIPFDDRVNHSADISFFDVSIINSYLREVKSELAKEVGSMPIEELVRKMNIAKGPDEYLKPINVGILMFAEDPQKLFRGAEIQLTIFEDEVGDNFVEQKFRGPLHQQLKNALQFFKTNIIKRKTRKVSGVAEVLRYDNYPYEAIEEALANAVYHKSYEHQSSIEVNVRLDRIEILSFPGPLPPLDNQKLQKERIIARDYRNRRIGDFLKELRLTEGRGTGIPKIRHSMRINGSPIPTLETDEDNTYFLTILPIHPEFANISLDDYKKSVLEFCISARSKKEILKHIGLKNYYGNFGRHILPLIESGYLNLTLPSIPRHRKQKYIISSQGKHRLN